MSKRNRSGDHISKDEFSVEDIRKDDIPKDASGKKAKKEAAHGGKCNPMMYRAWTAAWMLLCAALLARIWGLNHRIETLKERMDRLARIAVEQQDQLEELADALAAGRKGAQRRDEVPEQKDSPDSLEEAGQADAAQVSGQGIRSAAHKVYLTFDDGPSTYTEEILDILDRYGVKATFFVVGREGSQAQDALRRIVEEGHALGMHSYTHDYGQVYESVESFAADLEKEQDYLYEVTGVRSDIYRFPGGSSNTVSDMDMEEFAEYLDSQGIRFFDWNISSGDGGSFLVPVEMLIENCTATIQDHSTSVVLMHDVAGKTTTREALPEIIETIQAMEDTVLLPITEDTALVQHIQWDSGREEDREDTR